MRKLVTRLQAQLDVEEAANWHESRRPGLGLRFLAELDYVLKRVAAAPFQFPAIHPGVRRALLHRFPYSVYFLAGDKESLLIGRDLEQSPGREMPEVRPPLPGREVAQGRTAGPIVQCPNADCKFKRELVPAK